MSKASPTRVAKRWKKLPKGWTDESVRKFWDNLTSAAPKHKVTECIKQMEGKFDNPGAFCGGLADWMIPGWRQEAAKERREKKAAETEEAYWKRILEALDEMGQEIKKKQPDPEEAYWRNLSDRLGEMAKEVRRPKKAGMDRWAEEIDRGFGAMPLSLRPDYGTSDAALPRGEDD